VLAHLKTQETRGDYDLRKISKFEIVRNLFRKGFDPELAGKMFTFIDILMRLPEDIEQSVDVLSKEEKMPLINCFEKRGIEKGRVLMLHESILDVLTERFQFVPPETAEKLQAINEIGVLKSLHRLAIKTHSLSKFVSQL